MDVYDEMKKAFVNAVKSGVQKKTPEIKTFRVTYARRVDKDIEIDFTKVQCDAFENDENFDDALETAIISEICRKDPNVIELWCVTDDKGDPILEW